VPLLLPPLLPLLLPLLLLLLVLPVSAPASPGCGATGGSRTVSSVVSSGAAGDSVASSSDISPGRTVLVLAGPSRIICVYFRNPTTVHSRYLRSGQFIERRPRCLLLLRSHFPLAPAIASN
jgi:hypothetical protein